MSFVFLFCTERSGSNFITSLMSGHSQISGPPPSHLFRLFGLNCQNYHPSSNQQNWHAFTTDFIEAADNMIGDWNSTITSETLTKACPNRKISEALNHLYCVERSAEEQISFIKENYTYLVIPFILANWPDAKFVYQVRDPRDVAASWIKTQGAKGGTKEAVETWHTDQTQTLKIFSQLQTSNRAILVRYEDLITDTEATIQTVCTHIGVTYEQSMLEFYKNERIRRNADRISAWSNLAKPVLKNNSGNYKNTLTDNDIRYIELSCNQLMNTFGYQLETDVAELSTIQKHREIAQIKNQISKGQRSELISDVEQSMRDRRSALIERVKSREASK